MTFIVTLIGLLIERFFDWSHLRHWGWYSKYERKVLARLPNLSPYAVLAVTVLPLVIVVIIVQFLLQGLMYGLLSLLFQLFLFLYCLGPQNLWADAFSSINSLGKSDSAAGDKLKASFGVSAGDAGQIHRQLLDGIFIQANIRVFAVIFWYALLGPAGIVLYRLVCLSSDSEEVSPKLAQSAQMAEDVLNWLPAKLLTVLFALGGNFGHVITCWRKKMTFSLSGSDQLIADCGLAAIGKEDQDVIAQDGAIARSAISLLDRVFVITLVLVLLYSLLV